MSVPSRDMALMLATSACGTAEGAQIQATVEQVQSRYARMGAGVLLHRGEISRTRVVLRAIVEGAEGIAFTNDISAEGLAAARGQALESARQALPDPDHPGLPTDEQAGVPLDVDPWDEATAGGSSDQETQSLQDALDAARAHDSALAGIVEHSARARAVVNNLGLARVGRCTHSRARLIASCGEGSGHGGALEGRRDALDLRALGDKAGRIAALSKAPEDIEPGRYDVLLEPEAVIELLEWLSMIGLGAQSLSEGTSFLAGKSGDRLTGDRVTLYDAGPEAELLPVLFDAEGVARRRVDFVVSGIGGEVVHDRRSAQRAGCASTGHWRTSDSFPVNGPGTEAVIFAPGTDSGSMLEKLGTGLHVQRFHYVNGFLDPKKARMTGLTREGLFEVRDGETVRAVKDLRFTEDLLEAFGRIDGLGDTLHSVAGFWEDLYGAFAAPKVLIRDFLFSGRCSAN